MITTGTQRVRNTSETRKRHFAKLCGRLGNFNKKKLFAVCSEYLRDVECAAFNETQHVNGTCYSDGEFQGLWNYTLFKNKTNITRVSPSEEYYKSVHCPNKPSKDTPWSNFLCHFLWNSKRNAPLTGKSSVDITAVPSSFSNRVLHLSSGIDDMGLPHWDLVLSLLGAWTIAFFCMIKGIKSSGKVQTTRKLLRMVWQILPVYILFGGGQSAQIVGWQASPLFCSLLDPTEREEMRCERPANLICRWCTSQHCFRTLCWWFCCSAVLHWMALPTASSSTSRLR